VVKVLNSNGVVLSSQRIPPLSFETRLWLVNPRCNGVSPNPPAKEGVACGCTKNKL
jgi:hypothetical protein